MSGPSVRNRYNRGTAVIPSARDRRLARELEAEALAAASYDAGDLGDPGPGDDDGEGLAVCDLCGVGDAHDHAAEEYFDADALTEEDYEARDFDWRDARDRATFAEVAETTAFMRAWVARNHLAAEDHDGPAPRVHVCVDCLDPAPYRTSSGLCAMCALAHLEGVALSHLEAS